MTLLEVEAISKRYGNVIAIDGVSFSVERGELLCLLGPSGCGKSTTLRTIAGFETPDTGRIRLANDGSLVDVTDAPPNERDTSLVFQDWALFPNKTVRENVAFGLKMAGMSKSLRNERADEMLSLVEMTVHAEADPTQLSGGQKQRVALARSLSVDPTLLLLDEPLSNLDRQLRESMQLELKTIHERLETAMVYVTHDQDEAFTLADRIAIVNNGQIEQIGDPTTVYTDPETLFVESFLGTTNLVDCTVQRAPGETDVADVSQRVTDGGRVPLSTPFDQRLFAPVGDGRVSTNDHVTASIRPERLTVSPTDRDAAEAEASAGVDAIGTVDARLHRGSQIRYEIGVGEATLATERRLADALGVTAGESVRVSCPADAINFFDADGVRLR